MAEQEEESSVQDHLLPCSICSRTFKPESLEKHLRVCERNAVKKRKTFDSSKQRIQGTDLAEFLPVILRNKKIEKSIKKPESNWKEKHLELVQAVRAARGVGEVTVPLRASNQEKCPYCDRNFGPKAFDRHVEWCKEQKARIPKSPACLQAKERLEARTKYRAPPLAKSKRTLTKEKYARVNHDTIQKGFAKGSRSATSLSNLASTIPTEPKPTSPSASPQDNASRRIKTKSCNSSRSCPQRGNTQLKGKVPSPSPTRRVVTSGKRGSQEKSGRKKEEAFEKEHLFTSSCNITKLKVNSDKHAEKDKELTQQNSGTSGEVYDPYISAQRQMLELMSQENCDQLPSQNRNHSIPSPTSIDSSSVLPVFESSSRSAFVRYNSLVTPQLPSENIIPSSLIAEFEDLFISETTQFPDFCVDKIDGEEYSKGIPLDFSSLELHLSNNNIETKRQVRKPSKIRAKMESAALSLQRSVSLMNYENDMKLGTEASTLISCDNKFPLSEFTSFSISSPEPHLSSTNSLTEQNDNLVKKIDAKAPELCVRNDPAVQAKYQSIGGQCPTDSAYGSLNRQSPHPTEHRAHERGDGNVAGEHVAFMQPIHSVPPLCTVKQGAASRSPTPTPLPLSPAANTSPVQPNGQRLSKFCHECGFKYPVSGAKFCCECGARRLAV